ncbi:TraB/GumN family protein [Zavarzinia sp. CC-PAN008]|uniref:TraB/GumN family protein n=1 Tax=Zavarzinia sp. CC-PAN008 TaxID=3243332 RepID=UPI003F7472BF
MSVAFGSCFVRSIAMLVVLLVLPTAALAEPEHVPPHAFDQGMLWRIERPGTAASHILGGAHVSTITAIEGLPQAAQQALAGARRAAFEQRADHPADGLVTHMWYLPWPVTRELLGPDRFDQVQSVLQMYEIGAEQVARMRPMMLFFLLTQSIDDYRALVEGRPTLDELILGDVRARQLPFTQLETLKEQTADEPAWPIAQQRALIDLALAQWPPDQGLADAEALWRGQQLGRSLQRDAKMAARSGHEKAYAAFVRRLLAQRNARMAAAMEPVLREGEAFIVVGGAHLLGQDGILARLRTAGWTVTRAD